MANIKNNSAAQETQRRLLEAAGEVFAAHGFHSATIKEITDRAGACLASVNYHFNDKAELYVAVLRKIEEDATEIIPPDDELEGDAPARLRQFIHHLMRTTVGRGRPSWEKVLMAREFAEPSPGGISIIENVGRPLAQKLSLLIAELTGRDPGDEAVGLMAASILGQCFYHLQHRGHIHQIVTQLPAQPDVGRIADHIADFSLGGVLALR